ncbi:MAG: head GIN domain-containing protein, partial [Bacteroidota bacterium]
QIPHPTFGVNKHKNISTGILANKHKDLMKRATFSFIATVLTIVFALSLTSCGENGICITPTGEVMEQTLELDAISAFQINGIASVFVDKGTEQKVIVKARQAMLDRIDFSVSSGTLITDLDGCFTNGELEVFVTVVEPITEVSVSGSGDWENTTNLDFVDAVALSVSGSGNMVVQNIETKKLDANVVGSGDMTITGMTEEFIASVSGSGDIEAYNLTSSTIDAKVSGSGTLKVNADQADFTASVSGSGDIFYKGTPASIETAVTGSGDVKKR